MLNYGLTRVVIVHWPRWTLALCVVAGVVMSDMFLTWLSLENATATHLCT